MLPTKGYFQDIQCPFYNSSCGRPYCHFRHKRKLNENVEENEPDTAKDAVPTYKPTPKSELANIHNNKSHIPISYVPDLQFNHVRPVRPLPRIEKPTYKPTPLSILSSANKPDSSLPENDEHRNTIKDIQQNIADKVYDPMKSEINFENLSKEFDMIDNIVNEGNLESQEKVNTNLIKIENDIEEQQNKLKLLKSELTNVTDDSEKQINIKIEEIQIKNEKQDSSNNKEVKESKSTDREKKELDVKSDKSKHKSSSKDKNAHSKSSTSNEREKHRKEEKKNSSKENKSKSKSKEDKNEKKKSNSSSESSCSESTVEKHKKTSKERRRSKSKEREKHKKSRNRSTESRSLSSNKEHKSKHKSRTRSRSRSKHRSKEKDKNSKRREKESSDKKKEDRSHRDKKSKEKPKKSVSESSSGNQNGNEEDEVFETEENILSDVDLDLEDDVDETMKECFKIFSEYKPKPLQVTESERTDHKDLFEEDNSQYYGKKRTAHIGAESSMTQSKLTPAVKPKILTLPGQTLANRYKIAQLAQQNNEQANIMNEVRNMVRQPIKRPATSLLEAARQMKLQKMEQQKKQQSTNVIDDILNGVHKPSASQVKVQPKRIAAVPNVALIEKAKERISLIKQQKSQYISKTIVQTQKGSRVAHVPEFSLSDIPDVLQADKSKLPVNVRTRFLTMLADECGKLYAMKEDAYSRALNEEFTCYEKCKVLTTYRNSAMLAVNRLRKEIQERDSKGLGLILSGESITSDKEGDFKGKTFYNHVKKWMLNEEELDLHGYPKESTQKGKAIINNRKEVDFSISDENYRKCSRCSKSYQVDDDGWSLFEEECLYHPLRKRTIKGEQVYLCCKSNDETGCATSETHVFNGLEKYLLEGYQTTLPPERDDDPRNTTVYALDCEMCYTTKGLELTRVTIIDTECKTVYESFVKPLNPIIDYNTRFSGITKEQMDRTSTSILQIQANILHLCNSETVLVGHSLESDLKALKIIHSSIIDTSVLFPHKMGLPHKRALRALASEYLKKIIQNDVSGHDSAEDAIACMELIKWKLKEELKLRIK